MLKQFSIALGVSGCLCLGCLTGCTKVENKSEAPLNVTVAPSTRSTQNTGATASSGATAPVLKEETPTGEGQNEDIADELHTPAKGSAERQGIMDALRAGHNPGVVFAVNYLKVHNGWAWADVSPVEDGRTAEGGPALLHLQNGHWKVMNLSGIPENPDDPLEDVSVTPAYIKKVRKAFPKAPADIFPSAQ